jgi:phosphoglucan,water dikinase
LHSADPVSGERGKVSIEIAAGLGETLASANQPGRPWRLTVKGDDPCNGAPRLWSCADYSFAWRVGDEMNAAGETLRQELVNYADMALSAKDGKLFVLARKLAEIAVALEAEFGCPQDIEGAVVGAKIYLVQARPQQMNH